MGHDAHFLSRLDRVGWSDAELALTLYRDHELVAELVHRSSAPRSVERVAISLRDPVEGPFVIVASNGHFVTCLGEGMKTDLHVVGRDELDAITLDLESVRAAERVYVESGREMALRLFQRGDAIFREDLPMLRALQPALCPYAIRNFIQGSLSVQRLVPGFRRAAKRKAREARRHLSEALGAMWQLRNLALLAGIGSPRRTSLVARETARLLPGASVTIGSVALEQSFVTLSAAWWMAQLGESVVGAYLEELRRRESTAAVFDALTVLVALASKHPDLRPRIHEAVQEAAGDPLDEAASSRAEASLVALRALADGDCYNATWHMALKGIRPDSASVEKGRPSEVSDEESMPLALSAAYNIIGPPRTFAYFQFFVATAAALEAESLCLPRSLAHLHPTRLPPEEGGLALLDLRRPNVGTARAVATGDARNAPCSCGSGKKYKRCCGAR